MKRAIIIHTDSRWEGIYLDGKLMDQGHELGEGYSTLYTLAFAHKHNLAPTDFGTGYLGFCEELNSGSMPEKIDERFELEEEVDLANILK